MPYALTIKGDVAMANSLPQNLPDIPRKTLRALELTAATDPILQRENIIRRYLGEISLPTGRIIAIDPISLEGRDHAFMENVPPGTYPVFVYVTRIGSGNERIGLAELRISNEHAIHWKLAQTFEQTLPESLADADYGLHVDSATGAFLSPESLEKITEPKLYAEGDSFYRKYLEPQLSSKKQPAAFLFKLPTNKDATVAIFETGDSDGTYPSFFGYSEDGHPAKLVTTFYMIEHSSNEH